MNKNYDVIVAGGGVSGVSAAVSASRKGLSVLLIEQNSFLGGMGTSGLITMLMTSKNWFFGLGKTLIGDMITDGSARYIENPPVKGYDYYPFDAEGMKRKLDDIVISSGVDLLLYTKIVSLDKKDGKITRLNLVGMEGEWSVCGKVFVDATGDAYLCRLAGEKVLYGDQNGGIQAPTMVAYYSGIDFDKYERFLSTFDDGVKVPKINMIHTLVPIAHEQGVISEIDLHHPGIFRISENSDVGVMNAGHVYGANCSSAKGMTEATVRGRKMAKEYLDFYRKFVPGFENAYMTNTGNSLALRESFRFEGKYVTTFQDKTDYVKFDDAIMRFDGGAVSDLHASSSDKQAYQSYLKLFSQREKVKSDDYATLPYRSTVGANTDNLLVAGRCVSADRETLGQIRIMGYCFMMGQSAGLASYLAVQNSATVDQINVKQLQRELLLQGIPTI